MNNEIEFCKKNSSYTLKPEIYVACLGAYNNGYLHGVWIDATLDLPLMQNEIQKMLASSPIPNSGEFAIHSYGGFGGIYISESESLENISKIAHFILEHGELGSAVIAQTSSGDDIEYAMRLLEECYYGEYESEEDFAESFTRDTMDIPQYLEFYIDYESMARDLFINDFISVHVNCKTHVFSVL